MGICIYGSFLIGFQGEGQQQRTALIFTHPWESPTTRHIVPRRCSSRELHAVLLAVRVVGLILLPERVAHQRASIHPRPRVPRTVALQADPGDAVVFLHKVHLVPVVYDDQICPSLVAVFSAAFPGFGRSAGRDKVALAVEFFPSSQASFLWKTTKVAFKILVMCLNAQTLASIKCMWKLVLSIWFKKKKKQPYLLN